MPYTADSAGFDGIVSWNKMPNPLLVHGDVSWQGTMAVDQTIIILTITDTSASSFGTRLVPFGTRGFYLELQDTIHSFIHTKRSGRWIHSWSRGNAGIMCGWWLRLRAGPQAREDEGNVSLCSLSGESKRDVGADQTLHIWEHSLSGKLDCLFPLARLNEWRKWGHSVISDTSFKWNLTLPPQRVGYEPFNQCIYSIRWKMVGVPLVFYVIYSWHRLPFNLLRA